MKPACRRSDEVAQPRLDVHVNIFKLNGPVEAAGADLLPTRRPRQTLASPHETDHREMVLLGDVVENMVGDEFAVVTVMPVGADPHDFQPSAAQVAAINKADLVVANGLAALSNGPEVSRTPVGSAKTAVRFQTTMKMSTYLVAFIVGELEVTDPVDVDGIPLRIAYPPGKGHLTDYALEAGAFALRFFADYYDIPYPGAKMDKIAIPDRWHIVNYVRALQRANDPKPGCVGRAATAVELNSRLVDEGISVFLVEHRVEGPRLGDRLQRLALADRPGEPVEDVALTGGVILVEALGDEAWEDLIRWHDRAPAIAASRRPAPSRSRSAAS